MENINSISMQEVEDFDANVDKIAYKQNNLFFF